jgi:hypothetical protein
MRRTIGLTIILTSLAGLLVLGAAAFRGKGAGTTDGGQW